MGYRVGKKAGTGSQPGLWLACWLVVAAPWFTEVLAQAPDAARKQPKPAPAAAITPPKSAIASQPTPAPAMPVKTEPLKFTDLPGWAEDDHAAALAAFLSSCPRLAGLAKAPAKPNRQAIAPEMIAACEAAAALPARTSKAAARAFFERYFEPRRIVHAAGQGLLTGYYEPLIDGSRKREGRFQTPIYKRPADLVNIVDETQRGATKAEFTHMRRTQSGLVPHATRAEIETGALRGQNLELLYLADPVDVFFLQVQGSGRIRLPDGTVIRVHYDGKNGHPYTSIGRYLIEKGLFAADKMSLGALGRWLRADPERGRRIMHQNASYVFFRELPNDAGGPLGAMQTPLLAGRSLAVDPRYYALGSPVYVTAPTLNHVEKGKPFHRLMIAHDVGSAIKGPERGDIYFGSGEAAGRIAGVTKHPGQVIVLVARKPPAAPARKATAPKKAAP